MWCSLGVGIGGQRTVVLGVSCECQLAGGEGAIWRTLG